MNYGGEDNGMGLTMGLGGMAGLGNYGATLIEVNRILRSVFTERRWSAFYSNGISIKKAKQVAMATLDELLLIPFLVT